MPKSPYSSRIQTVSELTHSIRGLLETEFPFVTIIGEISNLRRPFSGHLYFTLKDRKSQIRGVMFKGQQRYLDETPEDGRQIICHGRISVYEPRGEYQIIVDFMDFHGRGSLQLAFEKLKNQLKSEGLFADEHKKQLPFLPEKICLVTSPDGAAVHDFLKISAGRFGAIPIEIFPVRVQGEGAADDIAQALAEVNKRMLADVIVLCRGGGSIEDLWPFNEEKVARAIFASSIPVVAAIGHEVDFTIADFVADLRVPTPTAAAEAVLPDRQMLLETLSLTKERLTRVMSRKINELRSRVELRQQMLGDPSLILDHSRLRIDNNLMTMTQAMTRQLADYKLALENMTRNLLEQSPDKQLMHQGQHVTGLIKKLKYTMALQLEQRKGKLGQMISILDAVNPHSVLGRGYSIVRSEANEQIIRNSNQVSIGEKIEIVLQKGKIRGEVTAKK